MSSFFVCFALPTNLHEREGNGKENIVWGMAYEELMLMNFVSTWFR